MVLVTRRKVEITLFENLMKNIYIAQMMWCEREVPVCAGTNKKKLIKEALRLLRAEYGNGPVWRRAALCSMPITANDIEIVKIPFLSNTKGEAQPPTK